MMTSNYACDKPKRPSKLTDEIAELQVRIKKECKRATFVGEFMSAKNIQNVTHRIEQATVSTLQDVLHSSKELITSGYELQRQKSSEAMVFLVCDLDRNWSKDPFRWAPICWFPKGYSLTTEVFRQIVEYVRNKCHQENLHIPCSSFDDQWHNMAVRDVCGRPLTILQLQKDVWSDTKKIQKSTILKEFSNLNTHVTWTKETSGPLILTNGGSRLPRLTKRGRKQEEVKDDKNDGDTNQSVETMSNLVPYAVVDDGDTGSNMLPYITCDEAD
jgi:hypothetical protein